MQEQISSLTDAGFLNYGREQFGRWGEELSDFEFAAALLLLGLIPLATRNQPARHQITGLRTILSAETPTPLTWYLDALPTEQSSWAAAHSAKSLHALITNEQIFYQPIAIRHDSVVSPLWFWGFFIKHAQDLPLFTSNLNLYVSFSGFSERTQFRWPVRVGWVEEAASIVIGQELQGLDYWNGNVFSPVYLDRRHCECDILVGRFANLGTAIEEVSRFSAQNGGLITDLLFLSLEEINFTRCEDLLPLQRSVQASGILLLPAGLIDEALTLQSALVEMSHNTPLSKAFSFASDGRALLITNDTLLKESQLSDRLSNIALEMQTPGQSNRILQLDGNTSYSFFLPTDESLSRLEAGNIITDRLSDFEFLAESSEASAIGELVQNLEEQDRDEAIARYLQAGIFHTEEQKAIIEGPLKQDTDYEVRVFVGESNPLFHSTGTEFPQLEPLNCGQSHQLTVVFWEPSVSPEPQRATIELPPTGDSSVCSFRFLTTTSMTKLAARITIIHRGRVLQTATLRAPVGTRKRKHTFTLDATPRRILNGLEERLNFDASFILNDMAGASQIHVNDRTRSTVLDWDHADIKELLAILGDSIGDITSDPTGYNDLFSPASETLLRRLAQKGASLREYLLGNVPSPSHVQLVMAKPDKVLPIEFVYEFEAPEPEATLCPNAAVCLNSLIMGRSVKAACEGVCPPLDTTGQPMAQDMLICPLAFWGIRCTIERRVHDPNAEPIKGDALLLSEPVRAKDRELKPTQRILIAATDRANPPSEPNATALMLERIHQVAGELHEVKTWKAWVDEIQSFAPNLLAILAHQTQDEFQTPALEIGSPPNLLSDLVKAKHVPQNTQSIALIIGCETSVANISYENFASRFHRRGAKIVVSTIAKILGRQAAPLTAEIIEEISRSYTARPFADIIRIVKCRLLLQGTPMVLALTAIGDADWDVINPIIEVP
ncbi:MAG: hypothetical protein CMK89_07345 [Pseudomonadales bacterium]|nr:hypothetical protein [Pseudomonadales bacterium]